MENKNLKVAVSTTSFAKFDAEPLKILKDSGFSVALNPFGRKLKRDEIVELVKDSIGLIAGTESLDSKVLSRLPALKVISRCGAGIDNVDLDCVKAMGIKLRNTPDAPSIAVAELAVGLLLALLRQIPLADAEIRNGLWKKRMGFLLSGKKAGIVGFGRIGKKTAGLLKALGADISFTDPNIIEDKSGGFKRTELDELLGSCDIISMHLSYQKENHKLFGEREFSLMKEGAFLVNCSRGGIIDENALYKALAGGRLAGAAVDVFESEPYDGPLKDLKNVILTPHIGSYAREARVDMEIEAVRNLLKEL